MSMSMSMSMSTPTSTKVDWSGGGPAVASAAVKGPSTRSERGAAVNVAPAEPGLGRLAAFGILAATLVFSLSFGAVFVLIADLQDRIGFPDWGLGAVVATSFLVSFGAEVSVARYAARGHARLLLAVGLALAAVGMVGFA